MRPGASPAVAELDGLSNVKIRTRTTVQGLYDANLAVLVERRDHLKPDAKKGQARQVLTSLRAKTIVMATGAIERPLVFSNNDRPGVMLASALRTYVNRFAVAPAKRAVIVANNDSAYETAADLAHAGVAVTVADHRPYIAPDIMALAGSLGIAIFPGTGMADVEGSKSVSRVKLSGAHAVSIDCDVLGMAGGWSPVVHLSSHGGIKPKYDEAIAAFVPGGFAATHFGAGAMMGTFGLAAAMAEGANAGAKAASVAGFGKTRPAYPPEHVTDHAYAILPVWTPAEKAKGKAFVDFQSDVTTKDVQQRPSGRLPVGRAPEALHHARHGYRSGQDLEHQCAGADGRASRHRDLRSGHDDLPPALCAAHHGGHRRAHDRPSLPPDAPVAVA